MSFGVLRGRRWELELNNFNLVLQILIVSLEGFLNFSLKSRCPGHTQVTEEKGIGIMSPFLMHLNSKLCVWTAADAGFAACIIGQVSYSLLFCAESA